jgi:hypothetical protein
VSESLTVEDSFRSAPEKPATVLNGLVLVDAESREVTKHVFPGRSGCSGQLEAGRVRSRQLHPEGRLTERWSHNPIERNAKCFWI